MKRNANHRILTAFLTLVCAGLFLAVLPAIGQEGGTRQSASGSDMEVGKQVYEKVCSKCHDEGISGAPKIGDQKAWAFRIAQGMDLLVKHAIEGFMCNRGVAPPRGGDRSLSDSEVAAATAYMVEKSR
jgi:cytochrome c5